MEALLLTDTKLSSTDYHDLKIDIVINTKYRRESLFTGWSPTPKRLAQLEAIHK